MSKRMLIDASHPEETRVVVLDGNRVEEFDFEAASKRPLKGNIYLAKVTRVEPSLQAAFVEYGGNRQGFLAFSEIHPDYYQIPVADRMALLAAQTQRLMAEEDADVDSIEASSPAPDNRPAISDSGEDSTESSATSAAPGEETESGASNEASEEPSPMEAAPTAESADAEFHAAESVSELGEENETGDADVAAAAPGEDVAPASITEEDTHDVVSEAGPVDVPASEEKPVTVQAESTGAVHAYRRQDHRDRPRPPRRRQYKIQEVIKRRQVMLVQVVKEERGNKGASLTTFLSLAGRYCVLMPNTPRGGGISRKITSATDRKRLKSAAQSLDLPEGMGLIIRTAGANRTKLEIKRDYEYLLRLWDTVRELTLKSNAPALVYEEGSLIKRAIRDLYNKDTSEILVDGEAGYRDAKDFMRMLMPSHAKNVKLYKEALPLFQRHQVESQLDAMFSPQVTLRSGGYVVINQTEALVSIDVNSGKATREHSIEETAHKTNLEAADEIARQLRLRDLAGLIVIDFIDMEDGKNDRNVEKRLHNAVRGDRARIQIGKISQFGLLEMSRQRLRAGVVAGSTVTCPHCNGQGIIRSTESAALRLLRALDEEGQHGPSMNITVKAPPDVTIYTLNQKRREIARIEEAYNLAISFDPQPHMMGGSFEIARTGVRALVAPIKAAPISVEAGFKEPEVEIRADETDVIETPIEVQSTIASEPTAIVTVNGEGDGQGGRRRRRRRRRGGRGRGNQHPHQEGSMEFHSPPPPHAPREFRQENSAPPAASEDSNLEATPPAGGQPAASPQAQGHMPGGGGGGEGGRRRRRRRGRRGRRREGEFGGSESQQSASFNGNNQRYEHPAEQAETGTRSYPPTNVVEPNAPSSPQWSLAEHSRERELRVNETSSARAEEAERDDSHIAEQVSVVAEPDLPSESSSEAEEANTPDQQRGTRKGWWQRRFKI